MRRAPIAATLAAICLIACPAAAQWVQLVEDPSRLSAAPANGVADVEEKDYAWADLDADGDIDLVVVRKQPWTSSGRRTNVLLMNESGVLTDRTADLAADSNVIGDLGFLTPTNDRDVVIVDVDGDQWPDVVTATTLTDNELSHISHPRVYMNLGQSSGNPPPLDGAWLGLEHQDGRIPVMHPTAGPRFCSVAAGDVTGDGAPDLYFTDYDSGGAQIFDFNDRLLINDGDGFFSDETTQRMTAEMYLSGFGMENAIADMNDDGFLDLVRVTALTAPVHISIAYNDPANEGFFIDHDPIYTLSAYSMGVGHLNDDGLLDVVAVDDGNDRYLLSQGIVGGQATFSQTLLPSQTGILFAGNVVIDDLDQDGWNDLILADADVDIPGCTARTFIFRNLGNGPNVSFQEIGEVIPFDQLTGVHDAGVFDIDGDGWLDVVLGRCGTTQVWMNVAPTGLSFSYPDGLPSFVDAGAPHDFRVDVGGIGASVPVPGSGSIFVSIDGGPFVEQSMQVVADNEYLATLPATDCPLDISFYVIADEAGGGQFTDPPGAPALAYSATAAAGTEITLSDDMEGDVSGWTVAGDESLTSGAWEQAEPNGTIVTGDLAAPDADATPGAANVLAFVTENGPTGGAAGANDVDGGPAFLTSPVIDLAGTDATISYVRWFFCDDEGTAGQEDFLTVEITADGVSWVPIPDQTTGGTGSVWEPAAIVVGDHVTPSATVQVRFVVADFPNNSVTEAGIDNFEVGEFICLCLGDLDGDDAVGVTDLLDLLAAWGACPGCAEDLDADGTVGITDLLDLLGAWGGC